MANIYVEVIIAFYLQPPIQCLVIAKFLFSRLAKRTTEFFCNAKELSLMVLGISDN